MFFSRVGTVDVFMTCSGCSFGTFMPHLRWDIAGGVSQEQVDTHSMEAHATDRRPPALAASSKNLSATHMVVSHAHTQTHANANVRTEN